MPATNAPGAPSHAWLKLAFKVFLQLRDRAPQVPHSGTSFSFAPEKVPNSFSQSRGYSVLEVRSLFIVLIAALVLPNVSSLFSAPAFYVLAYLFFDLRVGTVGFYALQIASTPSCCSLSCGFTVSGCIAEQIFLCAAFAVGVPAICARSVFDEPRDGARTTATATNFVFHATKLTVRV